MFKITFAHNYNRNVVSHWTSLVAQMVKNPPAMWETWIGFLGWEDPVEKDMATHSSILAWRIPMDRGLQFMGREELDTLSD